MRAAWVVVGLLALLLMGVNGVGYQGDIGPAGRVSSIPFGYAFFDTMNVPDGAHTPTWVSTDSLKIRRNGKYIPIRRVEVRYYGTARDTFDLEFGWSGQSSNSRLRVVVDSTAFRFDRFDISGDWVRVKPYNWVQLGEVHLLALGAR